MKLDDVLRLLDGAQSAAKFVVFDACRSEPQLPTKDTTKGLVPIAEQQGMFIAYASAPGHAASDRGEGSGPYAAALAAELGMPGLDHLNLFQNVKERVLASTGGAQQPWESNGLGRRVFLTGQARPSDSAAAQMKEVERAWAATKDTNSVAVLEQFVARFNDTLYADLARARLEELQKAKPEQLGLTVVPGTGANKNTVVVSEVANGSAAAQKGIKSGEVIVEIGGSVVKTPEDFSNSLKEATQLGRKAVLLRLKSNDGYRYIAFWLPLGKKDGAAPPAPEGKNYQEIDARIQASTKTCGKAGILAINGNKLEDAADLKFRILSFAPNTKVDLRILRGQKERTISVKLGRL